MEYLEHGDLLDYLYSRPPLPEDEARDIGNQILDALHMMHENGFAHRDLKPNVGWAYTQNTTGKEIRNAKEKIRIF